MSVFRDSTPTTVPNVPPELHTTCPAVAVDTGILLTGMNYQEAIRQAHGILKPRSYFEIGSLHGDTLRLANCAAVAVDPAFQLEHDIVGRNLAVRLHEQTSDDFFAAHSPRRLLGKPVDLAFLDGMHEFSFVLRDFINTERDCRRGSIILLHDCLPGDAHMTRPHLELGTEGATHFPGWWTGDVWKMVPVLRRLRPDLRITCLAAPPTGLVAVTRMNPRSRILPDAYGSLIAEWTPIRLDDWGLKRLFELCDPVPAETWLGTLRPLGLLNRTLWELRRARGRLGRARRGFARRVGRLMRR